MINLDINEILEQYSFAQKEMQKKRTAIPKQIREDIYHRQNGRCALCLERCKHLHHVLPVVMDGKNFRKNLIYLCEEHHKLFHVGDPTTIKSVFEYAYYLFNGELTNDPDSFKIAEDLISRIRNLR